MNTLTLALNTFNVNATFVLPPLSVFKSHSSRSSPQSRTYESGDFVRAAVLEVKRDAQRLLVTMKAASLTSVEAEARARGEQLGLVPSEAHLPEAFKSTRLALDDDALRWGDFARRSAGFSNPSSAENLCAALGLSFEASSASLCRNVVAIWIASARENINI